VAGERKKHVKDTDRNGEQDGEQDAEQDGDGADGDEVAKDDHRLGEDAFKVVQYMALFGPSLKHKPITMKYAGMFLRAFAIGGWHTVCCYLYK